MVDKNNLLEEKDILDVDLKEGQSWVNPATEERLGTENERIETGSIRVSKRVFEETAKKKVSVIQEEASVERKVLNEYVDVAPPPVRQEGDVTIISVVKEVLVVEKRLMLVEELHVTKSKTQTVIPVEQKVREEVVTVNQVDIGTNFEPLW
ncbi:DUF2382 domain-containing protein [Arcticibacter sp.]|jgi:uncharacterized protein (TIGR02271 family)|uniref:DUF2382 domain-containing protein n=1 Tax=Arcticibacter sp. TaxID=1872630 RepID=UPI00388CF433